MTKSVDLVPTWYWPDGVPRYLSPPRSSVYAAGVARWRRRRPEEPAIAGDRPVTYLQLDEMVTAASSRFRRALAGGSEPGRMAVVPGEGPEGLVALLGGLHCGADVLLVPGDGDLGRILTAFGCRLLVADAPPGGFGGQVVPLTGCGEPTGEEPGPESAGGRLALAWRESFALHPNPTLLAWALAFRAFFELAPADGFRSEHGLASWEGVVGALAPLVVGAPYLPTASPGPVDAAWMDWESAEAIGPPRHPLRWALMSVASPVSARRRRVLQRKLGAPVLTVFGTAASGPVAASPREWSIDEAVGTPFTGVDVVPLDDLRRPAAPPWHLLVGASVGMESQVLREGLELEGPDAHRLTSDGVLDTGAFGRMDANGFLYLL